MPARARNGGGTDGTELELASWRRVTSGLYAAEHVRACDPFGEDLGGLLVAARGEAG